MFTSSVVAGLPPRLKIERDDPAGVVWGVVVAVGCVDGGVVVGTVVLEASPAVAVSSPSADVVGLSNLGNFGRSLPCEFGCKSGEVVTACVCPAGSRFSISDRGTSAGVERDVVEGGDDVPTGAEDGR